MLTAFLFKGFDHYIQYHIAGTIYSKAFHIYYNMYHLINGVYHFIVAIQSYLFTIQSVCMSLWMYWFYVCIVNDKQ
jgi:hypothetical protein